MGHCATDTKLNRNVNLKILPEPFAADPDRLARFTREAQIPAGLKPNIGPSTASKTELSSWSSSRWRPTSWRRSRRR